MDDKMTDELQQRQPNDAEIGATHSEANQVKLIGCIATANGGYDLLAQKTSTRRAAGGYIVELPLENQPPRRIKRMAVYADHKALYALAAVKVVDAIHSGKLGEQNWQLTLYVQKCGIAQRIREARDNINNGGRKANGDKADGMHIWKRLVELIDIGRVRIVDAEPGSEWYQRIELLKRVAKPFADRAYAANLLDANPKSTLYDETDVELPPIVDVTDRPEGFNWSKRKPLLK